MATLGARMIGAMKADVPTFEEIERDPSAMGQAITVIAVAGAAALVGNIFRAGVSQGIIAMILSLIGYAIWAVLVTVIGTKLMPEPSTKADFAETFRTIAFAASPGVFNVLAIIPFLGPLILFMVNIWSLVIMVIAVRTVLDYSSTGRAIIVVLIGFVVNLIITFLLLAPLFVGAAFLS
jgi:hypothetical protein